MSQEITYVVLYIVDIPMKITKIKKIKINRWISWIDFFFSDLQIEKHENYGTKNIIFSFQNNL